RLGAVEVEDAMSLLMRLRGGGLATIDLSHVAAGAQDEMRFTIHGQNGALAFTLSTPEELRVFNGPRPAASLRVPASEFGPGWQGAYAAALSGFLGAVASGQPASPDFHDALKLQHLLTTSYEASRTKQWEEV
ncbi:MAG TPA: Gfo/Idh/MocA family oxidoreductase, partial [Bacteroidota bacterium]